MLLGGFDYKIINIAGNRESLSPGIGKRVEKFLIEGFTKLRKMNQ